MGTFPCCCKETAVTEQVVALSGPAVEFAPHPEDSVTAKEYTTLTAQTTDPDPDVPEKDVLWPVPVTETTHSPRTEVDERRLTVTLERVEGRKLGMVVGMHESNPNKAEIRSIKRGGIADAWNTQHPDQRLFRGYTVLAVNGRKKKDGIIRELADISKQTLSITVERPRTFEIDLMREADMLLGMTVGHHEENPDKAEVRDIKSGGLLAAWNAAHPSEHIMKGDQVVSVNGALDPDTIVAELRSLSKKKLHIVIAPALTFESTAVTVHVQREATVKWGMVVGMHQFDREVAEIREIKAGGVIDMWNKDNASNELRVGDQVISVNGAVTPASIVGELADTSKNVMVVVVEPQEAEKPGQFGIKLRRQKGKKLGLVVGQHAANPKQTLIREIVVGGLVDSWNVNQPYEQLGKGDQVISVNGLRAPKSIVGALGDQSTEVVDIVVAPQLFDL